MNRYTNLSFSSLNDLPVLALPWEQFDTLLANSQKQWDAWGQLKDLTPKFINTPGAADIPLYAEYMKKIDGINKKTTEAFGSGDYRKGMQALKEGQTAILKEWKPGGMAYALEKRYGEYAAIDENINKVTEKYKDPQYRMYYKDKLKENVLKQDIYNPDTRTYKTIESPTISAEVDILEEANKYFKDKFKDKKFEIRYSTTIPNHIEKLTVEGMDEASATDALNSFYEMPHIANKLDIETELGLKGVDQEATVANYLKREKEAFEKDTATLKDSYAKLEAQSKGSYKERTDLQRALTQLGLYDGSIDGDIGPKTLAGLEKIKEKVDREYTPSKVTAESLLRNRIKNNYTQMYVDPAKKRDVDLMWDRNADLRLKKQELEIQKKTYDLLERKLLMDESVVSQPYINDEVTLSTNMQLLEDSKKQQVENNNIYRKQLQTTIGDKEDIGIFTKDGKTVGETALILSQGKTRYVNPDGTVNPTLLRGYLATNGLNYTPAEAVKLATHISEDGVNSLLSSAAASELQVKTAINVSKQRTDDMMEAFKEKNNGIEIFGVVSVNKPGSTGTSSGRTSGQGIDASIQMRTMTPKELKEEYNNGNTVVIKAVHKELEKRLSPEEKKKVTSRSNMFVTDETPLLKNLKDAANANIGSYIRLDGLTTSQAKELGLSKEKGAFLPDNRLERIHIMPVKDVNTGEEVPTYIGVTNKGQSIQLFLPPGMESTYRLAKEEAFAKTYNPNTLTSNDLVLSNQIASSLYGDHSSYTPSNQQIKTTLESNLDWTEISKHKVSNPTVPQITYDVNWVLVKTKEGTKHLVSYDPTHPDQVEEVSKIQQDMSKDAIIRAANSGTGLFIQQFMGTDINEIDKVISTEKANTLRPLLEEQLKNNPRGTTKLTKTNVTDPVLQEGINSILNSRF